MRPAKLNANFILYEIFMYPWLTLSSHNLIDLSAMNANHLRQLLTGTTLVTLLALGCYALGDLIDHLVAAMVLLVAVSVLAVIYDILPVLVSALLSALLLNIFFIQPIPHYKIYDTESALLFVIYLVIASVSAVLTNRLRKQEQKVRDREEKEKTITLYNTLLNSLSHELKTPISTIIGSIDTLKDVDSQINATQRAELLSEMEIASTRLNKQVENLLNMSRLETGTLTLKKDWSDVNELIFMVIQKLPPTETQRIDFQPDETLPLFKLDSGLIETAVYAVVHNASRYSSSTIDVSACVDNNQLRLTVRDHGKGIPESAMSKVFDKFYRLPNSGTGGSGLGLSIAKGFIDAHGGTIQATNHPSGGACFHITIATEVSQMINMKDE